jgi:hypothetical protein
LFLPYLALVVLSIFTMIGLLSRMDSAAIQQRLRGAVPERLSGVVLIGFGVLFFLRGVGQVVKALTDQAALAWPEMGVLVADLLTTPTWVAGGVLLWRKRAFGYAAGMGLLFQSSMLFIGLLAFFIFQPFLTSTPFPVHDFVAVFVMGLICFIPFGLLVCGVITKGS